MRSLSLGEKIVVYKSLAISEITYLYLSPRNAGRTNVSSKKGRHLKFHSKFHFNDNIAKYSPSFYKIMFHNCRSSLQRSSVRKGVFRDFAKFKGKYTHVRVSFLIKLQTSAFNFIKKETLAKVLSYELCEISKNTSFTERLRVTASLIGKILSVNLTGPWCILTWVYGLTHF